MNCGDCNHFCPGHSECRELIGVLFCDACNKTWRAELNQMQCPKCDVRPPPRPLEIIGQDLQPSEHCPGFERRTPEPEPKAARKPKRKAKRSPQPSLF